DAERVDFPTQERPENFRRRVARRDVTQNFVNEFGRENRMLKQNAGQSIRWRPGVVVDQGKAADFPQDFTEERIEFLVVRQERKDFAGGTRDEERSPAVAIWVTENGNVASQWQ